MMTIGQRVLIILMGAWRRRYVIAVPVVLFPIIGFIIGKTTPRYYDSHTSMLIQETAKMNPFLEDLAVSTMLKDRLDALKTLLHSRHILASVAKERGLISENPTPAELDYVIGELSSSLKVTKLGRDLLKIEYRSSTSEGMAETLEAVSVHFVEQLLAPERSSMVDSQNFLATNIKYRQEELDKAEANLADFKSKNGSLLPEMQLEALGRLAKLKQRLFERQAEYAGAKKTLGSLDVQLSKTNPVVGKIEEQIIRIRSDLTLLRAKYTDSHSKVQAKIRNLRRLEVERNILLEQTQPTLDSAQLWDIASSSSLENHGENQPVLISQLGDLQKARSNVDSLSEEIKTIQIMISELEVLTSSFGENEKQLLNLQRDLALKRQLYDNLMERFEMARLTSSLGVFEQEKRVKVIDRPYTPSAPSNLPPIVFLIAGIIGGLGMGAGIALILELTDTAIRRRDEVEKITGKPVLTRVPKMKNTNDEVLNLGSETQEVPFIDIKPVR
ncbi:GumC family protein [Vibrio penaeicida]|uniref:Chain-length determining protein n=1 Tax=Vibrio penaeicida TaxID=104609 RepID=A0AAV5P017_9VIBR|nr:GNVR domain-containing protein [Vibrio penaeicida]RTZ20131.1 chain-length determining protein [Vibrio penaeicida]GLQ75617.1 chain-length determining protein [Vibrio penaeicida]